eukprot:66786-Amphidinium_carterae.3
MESDKCHGFHFESDEVGGSRTPGVPPPWIPDGEGEIIDIRHLDKHMNALVCDSPDSRSWIVDSGSGEHLVGRSHLNTQELQSTKPLERT